MINHDLCRTGLTYFPTWPCPACRQGTIQYEQTSPVKRWPGKGVVSMINEGHIERCDDYGVFSVTLRCSNRGCSQGVAVLGDYSTSLVYDGEQNNVEHTYKVRDIYPAILLIDIPANLTPEPIDWALQRNFALYWRDPQACAVTIRTAIEGITEHLRQRRKQNGKFISLETRLDKLDKKHADIVEAAKAVKDIGNDGAHGDAVGRDKLLTAYELLEIELRQIFNDDDSRRRTLITKLRP